MRLLRLENDEFRLHEYVGGQIPEYAILSHTWGPDDQEVTFKDLVESTGKSKKGYEKLRFCAKQSANDGLEWFWVDTCCIEKSSSAELSEAINSMFRWYHNATKCYVYLSDVSTPGSSGDLPFQQSRWFTRGWTLQELLAPKSVDFFSADGEKIGDRSSMMEDICTITGINVSALQGRALPLFSVNERLSWAKNRVTKREEDQAYSLLDIFDIQMPLLYGEGREKALARLRKEIEPLQHAEEKDMECIQDLRLTDPRDDKKRIEETKGGLLEDSYRWILENPDFRHWRDDEEGGLLWVKGDPGKGKTMLLCGLINELSKVSSPPLLSYFFCQATDSRINSSTAVLRGLLYLLIDQQPKLMTHIRKKYSHAGAALFQDANAWIALSEVLTNILQDPALNQTYLIIDALDECLEAELPRLLDFLAKQSSTSSRVNWIVSSRNWQAIEDGLGAGQMLD